MAVIRGSKSSNSFGDIHFFLVFCSIFLFFILQSCRDNGSRTLYVHADDRPALVRRRKAAGKEHETTAHL